MILEVNMLRNKMTSSMEHVQIVKEEGKEEDYWDVVNEVLEDDTTTKKWTEQTGGEKCVTVVCVGLKFLVVLGSLYLFICSLSFLSSSFQLLGGKSAGEVFAQSKILNNPIIGLMIGVLVTVLVQSSSTSTSIIVAMVSAGIITIRPAISMIMGANIGTTVTNTIVSLGQSLDRKQFRRAFAGATVHDCFNWLCVCIFLPLEALLHPLELLSGKIVSGIKEQDTAAKLDFLKVLTKPFTGKIISINKDTIKQIAKYCTLGAVFDADKCTAGKAASMMKVCDDEATPNLTESCEFLFSKSGFNDTISGVILLAVSLLLLCACLTVLVKTLQSLLLGRMAQTLKRHINSDLPDPFGWFTGYIFILVGVGMTILVQSSSVFTSSITPLVGLGVISIDRMFPLTLGSNIGTTATAMLAAFAATGDKRAVTIQVAISHLLFNVFGIMVFYPVPFMRKIPISGAKFLGNTTAKYRWFAVAYLLVVFLLLPLTLVGVSFSTELFSAVVGVGLLVIVLVTALNLLHKYCPDRLPDWLKTWDFLPAPCRTLEPYDRLFARLFMCFRKVKYDPLDRSRSGSARSKDIELSITQPNGINGPNNGNVPNGNVPKGNVPNGNVPNGNVPNGNVPNGNVPNGNVPNGNTHGIILVGEIQ